MKLKRRSQGMVCGIGSELSQVYADQIEWMCAHIKKRDCVCLTQQGHWCFFGSVQGPSRPLPHRRMASLFLMLFLSRFPRLPNHYRLKRGPSFFTTNLFFDLHVPLDWLTPQAGGGTTMPNDGTCGCHLRLLEAVIILSEGSGSGRFLLRWVCFPVDRPSHVYMFKKDTWGRC